ncbi:helix-turn-helix domain-containing protein [Micromonospora azadirachtae]|uniref:Helix-turn-helix domain-containing protein n=1 Tax=Micromonospora azadirachtae TaxID=1970735 RepID=A0ABW2ZW43_9ACTN
MAGLSVDYYARLEQGRQRTASPDAPRAVARAMHLSDDERRHLFTLAAVPDDEPPADRDDSSEFRARRVVAAFRATPCLVSGPPSDVIHANPAASRRLRRLRRYAASAPQRPAVDAAR